MNAVRSNEASKACPQRRLVSLDLLNRMAREQAFSVDDLDWSLGVDRTKPWSPDAVGPLWFVPGLSLLDEAQRLRCNQLHALALAEKFIWFERQLIHVVSRLLGGPALPAPLGEALQHFVREEDKHMAMFWRLLSLAEPGWYRARQPRLHSVSPLQRFAMDRIADHPDLMLAWVWLAIFVEERTLFLSRAYLLAERQAPGRVDPLHTQVHMFHWRDEARHHQLDQHLLTWLYDPQPRWKRALAAWMFRRMVRAYVAARRAAPNIVCQLGREFPGLRARIVPRLLAELAQVERDPAYHRALFSPAALPHTLALLARYPEHEGLWRLLPAGKEAA